MGTGYGLAKLINKIFKANKLQFLKLLRLGPRFFITLCQKNNKKCVFKINLYPRTLSPDTKTFNEHLAREIIFLKYVRKQKKFPFLKNSLPKIYNNDINCPRTWYIKNYTEGGFQNINQSNFLFKKSFFNQNNLNWIVKFFTQLHSLSQILPTNFKKIFHYHQLNNYLRLIDFDKIGRLLKSQSKIKKIINFLHEREKIFNQSQLVFTHFEPYASHFIKKNNGFIIIDWENVGWGNASHDIGVVWLRAYDQKKWRDNLIKNFYRSTFLKKHFWDLFKMELLIQCIANLPYISHTTDPDEQKVRSKIFNFFKSQIDLIITDKFEIHE
jgi:thiamine kinase-like enzyme